MTVPSRLSALVATIVQDLRYGARSLRKSPAYTAVAVLTLAIGVGANSAIFTVAEAALLRTLPYRAPERVVHLWETTRDAPSRQLSYPDYRDVRDGARSFEGVAGYGFFGSSIDGADGREPVSGARVTANFLATLGVAPALGRDFVAAEDATDGVRDVVLISHGFWRRRFGADAAIVGSSVTLGGAPFTVIGVLPASFQFAPAGDPEMLVTLSPPQSLVERRFTHWMYGVARLAPGATREQANAELAAIAARRGADDARWHADTGLRAEPVREAIVGGVRPLVLGLAAVAGAVLLIACANLANMTLARAGERRREVGIRVAVGAGRGRLVRQFLTESLLLSLAGGAAGLLWAGWGVRAILATIPADQARFLPYLKDVSSVDPGVVGFTVLLCLLTSVAFGLPPALRSARQVADHLRAGRGPRSGAGRQRLRGALVVVETALTLVLLVGAGLMTRSLQRLLAVDPGFETSGLVTVRIQAPASAYDTPEKREAFWKALSDRVRALPAVAGVAAVDALPLVGAGNTGIPSVVGMPVATESTPAATLRTVSPDYFEVLGLPLASGRAFAATDRAGSPRVVVVNREFERQLLAGAAALGRRITFAFVPDQAFEVVGVVGDELVGEVDGAPRPVVYFSQAQDGAMGASLVVRSAAAAGPLLEALRREARALDPAVLVTRPATMDEVRAGSRAVFLRRFTLALVGAAAVASLLLAMVGVYGVMSYSVTQRRDEIGVRMAMGARPAEVLRMVLRQGLGLALGGVFVGTALALFATRSLSRVLFETPPSDPLTLTLAATLLAAVALVACAVPAARAARVDPARVLSR